MTEPTVNPRRQAKDEDSAPEPLNRQLMLDRRRSKLKE